MSDSRDAKTTNSDEKPIQPRKQTSWVVYARRWGMRAIGFLIAGIICFPAAAWIMGNTPVNRNFQHADAEVGIDILVINNGVHVDRFGCKSLFRITLSRFANKADCFRNPMRKRGNS